MSKAERLGSPGSVVVSSKMKYNVHSQGVQMVCKPGCRTGRNRQLTHQLRPRKDFWPIHECVTGVSVTNSLKLVIKHKCIYEEKNEKIYSNCMVCGTVCRVYRRAQRMSFHTVDASYYIQMTICKIIYTVLMLQQKWFCLKLTVIF